MSDNVDRQETPFILERLLRSALHHEKSKEAASSELEFIETMDQAALKEIREQKLADDPVEMAQELAFQAYECGDRDDARELAEKALVADPTCVDALTVRAFLDSDDAAGLIDTLGEVLDIGENMLGEEFFSEYMGDFWGMVEARPYMRTTKQLAELMWSVGRRFDAVACYENLIELDPEDHMGNATPLLGFYLGMGEVQRSWDLLEEFDTEDNTLHSWAWVLLFLWIGEEEAATKGLHSAMEMNPYVASLLVGIDDDDDVEILLYHQPGSIEEAHYILEIMGEAWSRDGETQMWLFRSLSEMGLIEIDDDEDGDESGPVPN